MQANKIITHLEQYFPISQQQDWDNCGLQVGNPKQDIQEILVCLDVDELVIDYCIKHGYTMIISHHPFLFSNLKRIDTLSYQGRCIQKAIKHDLVIYSLHTCLDLGVPGVSMNDWLIGKLNVHSIRPYDLIGIGKKAILNEPKTVEQFLLQVKQEYHLDTIKYTGPSDKMIRKVAICGGSGSSDVYQLASKVDAYLTGDVKYHEAQHASLHGLTLIDIGHHAESIMENEVSKLLEPLELSVHTMGLPDYIKYQ